eukprot:3236363-Rhodomonas_salina.1
MRSGSESEVETVRGSPVLDTYMAATVAVVSAGIDGAASPKMSTSVRGVPPPPTDETTWVGVEHLKGGGTVTETVTSEMASEPV